MSAELYKIVVTVPENDADVLRNVISKAGAGILGKYSGCSFSAKGIGRFVPKVGSNPSIGNVGKPEEVIEERIEVSCDSKNLQNVIKAIRIAHPYEEPSIDVYPLLKM